ncbi:MAG: glycosyltransferase [Gammaproteobacteria bacterium]|nr:glycosyltransferase [Gammaproteobacteria bacterium]MDH3465794.1 glycosyltransferase [Gammaproteobacteria bacterium]
MNILMMTNTFSPHVGGVARSIKAFSAEYRQRGHRVLVVAPTFDGVDPNNESDVIRIPAIQHFRGSDFSVALPVPGILQPAIDKFKPDVIHSHHPFLIGGTALRVAHTHGLPLIYTNHTKYENYTHYLPGDSERLKRFVISLSTNYANVCDQIFAPSDSIATLLRERGVQTPIAVVPTGVDTKRFRRGNGMLFRKSMGIPGSAFVIGHLGRLAEEKNLEFLSKAIASFLGQSNNNRKYCFLLIGEGPVAQKIIDYFNRLSLNDRLYVAGVLNISQIPNAYAAMDVFAFASKSETQGMVLTEAMAGGVPVVAVDASGVREVVQDGINGRLLDDDNVDSFVSALGWMASRKNEEMQMLINGAVKTAHEFSIEKSARKALELYRQVCQRELRGRHPEYGIWTRALHFIDSEWMILRGVASAAGTALGGPKR